MISREDVSMNSMISQFSPYSHQNEHVSPPEIQMPRPTLSQEGSNIDSESDKVSPCGKEENQQLRRFDSNS